MSKFKDFLCDVGLVIGVWLIVSGGSVALPSVSFPSWLPSFTTHATAATYVFEKDTTSIPNGVASALNTLNAKGIIATTFEEDTVDGGGQTPTQYVAPLAAAKSAGLPALVATAGTKVLKVTKNPQTEQDVLGGVP